jgi:hypothetical protein
MVYNDVILHKNAEFYRVVQRLSQHDLKISHHCHIYNFVNQNND